MQTIEIPFQAINSDTVKNFKALPVHDRTELKLIGLKQLNRHGKTAPAMYVLTSLINQHTYVFSGACQRNIDRYEREKH